MRPNLQEEENLVDRETDSSALPRAQYSSLCSADTSPTLDLLGMDGGASGYALVASPPSRSEGMSSQVRG
jgi:hypothetical protein